MFLVHLFEEQFVKFDDFLTVSRFACVSIANSFVFIPPQRDKELCDFFYKSKYTRTGATQLFKAFFAG